MSERRQHTTPYTHSDIERYLQGKLSSTEMHAMEKAALQDPFLADAIEGFNQADSSVSGQHLSAIKQQLLQEPAPVKHIGAAGGANWWRVAAGVILVTGAAGIGWLLFRSDSKNGTQRETADIRVTPPLPAIADSTTASRAEPAKPAATKTVPDRERQLMARAENARREKTRAEKQAADLAEQHSLMAARTAREPNPPAAPPPSDSEMIQQSLAAVGVIRRRQGAGVTHFGRQQNPGITGAAAKNISRKNTSGIVLSEFNGVVKSDSREAVPNATIVLTGEKTQAASQKRMAATGITTNDKGEFRFLAPDSIHQVQVAAVGFVPRQLTLATGRPAEILLSPSREALAETVMAAAGDPQAGNDSVLARALNTIQPDKGWGSFNRQLKQALAGTNLIKNRSTSGAPIQAEISIDRNGMVYDVTLRRSIGREAGEALIKTLKQVSGWTERGKPLVNTTRSVTIVF
ncbi:carboxypeptidase-like regulatory domain-containing protein [Sediminibacterium soli]|uniref:carboxypeptidase-like regulatory domain-containing protein n=1 Tax=Sediminibacterium soli TaxID=2698829 RepID=UPI00137AA231|nr:carboxypeptidase-like regulatory domain-containing protein [Sediminibacterium soli]NCI45997.1 carboxypeptidase regulatory-like domain-containing protein [Sediminibacterium soli]